jgi:hypothetical protein
MRGHEVVEDERQAGDGAAVTRAERRLLRATLHRAAYVGLDARTEAHLRASLHRLLARADAARAAPMLAQLAALVDVRREREREGRAPLPIVRRVGPVEVYQRRAPPGALR